MRRSLIAVVTVLASCLCILAAAPSSQPASRAASVVEPAPLAIGSAAPDFDLPGVDGRRYKLSDFAEAKVLVVIFTCNHCPTAQGYEERIKQLVASYKDKPVRFVAISPNDPVALRLNELGYTDLSDTFEAMKIRAKDAGFNFPYLYDGDTQKVSRAYGPQATPHVFIFDEQRKLRYRGRVDDADNPAEVRSRDTQQTIDALLAGRAVPVETTKTFGCSTKWSDKRQSVADFMEKLAKEPVNLETISSDALTDVRSNKGEKLRLINVWASWCGPCLEELPELVETDRMYRHRKFEFVTISMDRPEQKSAVLELLKKNQMSNRNLICDKHRPYEVIEKIDPEWSGALPYTILVEPGGKVIYRKLGTVDPLELRRAIVGKLGRTYH